MTLINHKYQLIEPLGNGSFGTIFKAQHIRTKEFVAIKVEPIQDNTKLLKHETIIYKYLYPCKGIPLIKWFGKDDDYYYMVISLLGPSLKEFHMHNAFSFSIGIQIITLLQTIHNKGLVHRDIKPDNFLLGKDDHELYIIDFGFCKSYLVHDKHIPMKSTHCLIGSLNYASIHAHQHMELSRRDDLESAIYILLYLWTGMLPWSNVSDANLIFQQKRDIVNNRRIPPVLIEMLRYIRQLSFEDTPDYSLLVTMLERYIEN